jgi:hypothetical protein
MNDQPTTQTSASTYTDGVVFRALGKGVAPRVVNPTQDEKRRFAGFDEVSSRDKALIEALASKYQALGVNTVRKDYSKPDGSATYYKLQRSAVVTAESALDF